MPRILRLRFKHGQNRKYEEDVEQNVFRGVTFKAQHHVPTKIIYDFMAFAPVYSSRDNHSIIRASIAALETLRECKAAAAFAEPKRAAERAPRQQLVGHELRALAGRRR